MSAIVLLSIIFFCLLHFVIAIFLKKRYAVYYDRRTLIPTLLFLTISILIYVFAEVSANPQQATLFEDKMYWLILISFGSYAVIQFITWFIYSLLRYNKVTRLPRFVYSIFALVFIIIVIVMSAKYLFDINLAGFLVTSTILSAIIGLSVQDTLTNFFAGVSLQSESPFTLGEWVFVGGQEGKVVDQNWRSLTLLSRANHRITLPNKLVAQEKIVNYSRPTPRQIHIFDVNLDYAHPPNEIKQILNAVLNDMNEVTIDDMAHPFIKEYADSGIIYSLKFWIEDYGLVPIVQDKVLARLWYALNRKNIKIPYPIRELHVQMTDQEATKKKQIHNKKRILNELKDFRWLKTLSTDQLEALSEKSWIEAFAKGENLISEGNEGDSMFIIVSGHVDVLLVNPEGINVKIASKSRGDFFGEMSLLTGKPRSATIRAAVDTTVVIIDKKAFTEILLKDSGLLDLFFTALESNKSALAKHIEDFSQQEDVKESGRVILLRKIREYLNIAH